MRTLVFFGIFFISTLSPFAGYVVTSHKTAGLEYSENTLEGFLHSLDLNVQAIELDIHFTKDREIVLSHDPVFDNHNCFKKGSSKKLIIAQSRLEEILELNCFDKKLKRYYKVPTLDEVLQAYKDSNRSDIEINLEIKVFDKLIENWDRYKPLDMKSLHIPEAEMATLTMKKLREFDIKSKILFATFSEDLLLKLKSMQEADESHRYGLLYKGVYAPIRLGLIVRLMGLECFDTCWLPQWKKTYKWMVKNKIDVFLPNFPQLTHPLYRRGFKRHFQKEEKRPFEIYPWTPNSEEEWKTASEYQFDGMITDKPTAFLEWSNP